MYETESELDELQTLLDRSFAGSGQHMGNIVTAERRLNARQVANYLQGVKHVAFATANSKGEPFVSPLDGFFIHGRYYVGTSANAVKAKHVRRNPAVSAVHMVGDDVGIWIHGRASEVAPQSDTGAMIDRLTRETYGTSWFEMGEAIVVWMIEPRVMFAYAPDPAKFPA